MSNLNHDNESRQLDKAEDTALALLKGLAGSVPGIGPVIVELMNVHLPNRHYERFERMCRELDQQIKDARPEWTEEHIKQLLETPEFGDLFEKAGRQATQASSQERIERIASLLKNSLTDEEVNAIEAGRMLDLLNELNDMEVLLLQYYFIYYYDPSKTNDWWQQHPELHEPLVHYGSTDEEVKREAMLDSYKINLVRLGLARPQFKKPSRGKETEIDFKTGMVKSAGHQITTLGILLVVSIDAHLTLQEQGLWEPRQ